MKQNNLLGIAPGGVYEAQLGDNTYELLWKQRIGYAKAAIEAQVVRLKEIEIYAFIDALLYKNKVDLILTLKKVHFGIEMCNPVIFF